MNCEILAVGTELLLGDILNTNAQYLSRQLAMLGINVYYQTVVGDNRIRLLNAYKNAFERSDIVIATGGLGPTEDDLTKETAAEYFNRAMVLDQESLDIIENFFRKQNSSMAGNNKKQAYIPEGSRIIPNNNGTAPGCIVEDNGKILIMLPGPPRELEPMFESYVFPFLRQKTNCMFISRSVHICGVGESRAEEMIRDIIDTQTNPTIATYAKTSTVTLRVTARAEGTAEAQAVMQPVVDEIYKRFSDNIYGEDETTLEAAVVGLLAEKGLRIAFAESCTGGMLTARIVDCPGASEVLLEGMVTYSNEAKMKRLGVKEETLRLYGAVSSQTAIEMAEGIAKSAGADIGVSVTGIAGPGGGTDTKPVGLVYIGLFVKGKVTSKEFKLLGNRAKIRERSVINALDMVRRAVKE